MELRDGQNRKINYLRLSLTDRCNLRCNYCMPEDGYKLVAHNNVLSLEEFAELSDRFVRLFGVDKVRITGGEPLIKKNIEFLISHLASNPGIQDLAITTNGILLPEKGAALYDAGIRRLNISLDTLNDRKFAVTTRIGKLKDSLEGIRIAKEIGFSPIKINTVLLPGYDEESEMIEWANTEGFMIRFIELMPGKPTDIEKQNGSTPRLPDLIKKLEQKHGKIDQLNPSPEPGHHTESFKVKATGWVFEVIPAISNHFCQHCNRIRVNCEGIVRYCLYSNRTLQIRDILDKSDDEFADAMSKFVNEKVGNEHDSNIKSYMFSIGG